MPLLLYIHGFNSSPESYKARHLKAWLKENHPELSIAIPYLKPYPKQSIGQLKKLLKPYLDSGQKVGLMGSSLGGFYATHLAELYSLPAVLINPSIRPFDLLVRYLGENKNFYNDDHYLFEHKHVDELLAINKEVITPEQYLLLVQSGDETLDFKEATAKYIGSRSVIEYGGDHSFQNFDRWFRSSLKFLQLI